jgi:Tol biopolymer transport system component
MVSQRPSCTSSRALPWCHALVATCVAVAGAAGPQTCPLETLPQQDEGTGVGPGSASISASGRYLAFASYARLIAADTNRRSDIYVHDLETGRLTIESLLPDGTSSNGDSVRPSISADGRFVAFESVGGLTGGRDLFPQVLLRDRQLGVTRVLSRSPTGELGNRLSARPVISADGGVVAFESAATNLLPPGESSSRTIDVYATVLATGRIRPMSPGARAPDGTAGFCFSPALSSDGRYLALTVKGPPDDDAGPGPARPGTAAPRRPGSPPADVVVHDLLRGIAVVVSRRRDGRPANGRSYLPAISGDGRFVAFVSEASDLVEPDGNGASDVFLHDLQMGRRELVSRTRRGRSGNGASSHPALSRDARFIAFQSDAADLVCAGRCSPREKDINLASDVFLLDRVLNAMVRLSEDPDGPWMERSGSPVVDGQGDVVVFASRRPIDDRDGASDFDLFVRRCGRSMQVAGERVSGCGPRVRSPR